MRKTASGANVLHWCTSLSLPFSLGCNTPAATQGLDEASGEHHFISQEQVCAPTLGHRVNLTLGYEVKHVGADTQISWGVQPSRRDIGSVCQTGWCLPR